MSNFIGWEAETLDGKIYREGQCEWKDVPKKHIIRLSLFHYNGRRWDLTGKEAYGVRTRGSIVPGVKESFQIERRTIFYYEGATKVCYHVDEMTGKFTIEVIDTNE